MLKIFRENFGDNSGNNINSRKYLLHPMAKKDTNKDGSVKNTTTIDVSGIPVVTLNKLDKVVAQEGITRSAYIKNLINQDLKDGK